MSGGVEAGLTVTIVLIVCLIGVCTAEPHVVDADEWNTTVKDLVDGNDPRQPSSEPEAVGRRGGVVGVVSLNVLLVAGVLCLIALAAWVVKRRAKR